MKKKIQIVVIITGILFLAISCVRSEKNQNNKDGSIVEIREKMFIGQVYDVYLNPDDYLGKTLKLEGVFIREQYDDGFYNMVIRYGPGGCCGIDGLVGFEVAWENKDRQYPENDSWVEAIGELKFYKVEDLAQFMYIDLISLDVLDKRGEEYVNQ
jgi:uncharacterized membrane protein YcgQ (UPF0703/DUF1980 family)